MPALNLLAFLSELFHTRNCSIRARILRVLRSSEGKRSIRRDYYLDFSQDASIALFSESFAKSFPLRERKRGIARYG